MKVDIEIVTTNHMSKAELIECINTLASKFLGFTTVLSRLQEENKADLRRRYKNYIRMVNLMEEFANTIQQVDVRDMLTWASLPEDQRPAWYRPAFEAQRKAIAIWHGKEWE